MSTIPSDSLARVGFGDVAGWLKERSRFDRCESPAVEPLGLFNGGVVCMGPWFGEQTLGVSNGSSNQLLLVAAESVLNRLGS